MSFSQDVKQELSGRLPISAPGRVAFLAGMFMQCGHRNPISDNSPSVRFQTENQTAARICFTLLRKTFNIGVSVCVRKTHTETFILKVPDSLTLTETLCLNGDYETLPLTGREERRAFITGSFICSGSINDPAHSYHFEIVCSSGDKAAFLKKQIDSFGINAGITERRSHYVVYVKDGSDIVDMLGVMDAPVSLMNMENSRIVRDMRNSVNRRVNCETANIQKTVSAAVRQADDIRFLSETGRLKGLSPALRAAAEVRLKYPELPLKELGEMMDPPVGKSGMNHRLRKLSEIAALYR